eukprot:435536-Prymnesium_polylepis.1
MQLANMLVLTSAFHQSLVIPARLRQMLLSHFELAELRRFFCVEDAQPSASRPASPPPLADAPIVVPGPVTLGHPEASGLHAAAYAALFSRPKAPVVSALGRLWAQLCGGAHPCRYSAVHLRHMDGQCHRRMRKVVSMGLACNSDACHMPPRHVRAQLRGRGCGTKRLYVADDHQNATD